MTGQVSFDTAVSLLHQACVRQIAARLRHSSQHPEQAVVLVVGPLITRAHALSFHPSHRGLRAPAIGRLTFRLMDGQLGDILRYRRAVDTLLRGTVTLQFIGGCSSQRNRCDTPLEQASEVVPVS